MRTEPYRTYGIVALELIVFWAVWFSPMAFAHADYQINTASGIDVGTNYGVSLESEFYSATPFTTTEAGYIPGSMFMYAKDLGATTDDTVVQIRADNGGEPGGDETAIVEGFFSNSELTGSCEEHNIPFAGDVPLEAATTYWMVTFGNGGLDEGNHPQTCGDEGTAGDMSSPFLDDWTSAANTSNYFFDVITEPLPPEPPLIINATTSIIYDPTRDMFNGIILFFIPMFFMIWFFRRPYDTY